MATCIAATKAVVTLERNSRIAEIGSINQVKKIDPISFCHWAVDEWGNAGKSSENSWYYAAMAAVATLNTLAQIQIANMRYSIAKEYAKLARDQWARFRDNYAPCERATIAEICSFPPYEPIYEELASLFGGFSIAAFRRAEEELAKAAKQYSLCVDPGLVASMAILGSISHDDSANFAYRVEEAEKDIVDDLVWNRRSSLLNLGKNIHAQSAKYADAADQSLNGLGKAAQAGIGGAMSALGYFAEKNDTVYNSAPVMGMHNYNGSYGVQTNWNGGYNVGGMGDTTADWGMSLATQTPNIQSDVSNAGSTWSTPEYWN